MWLKRLMLAIQNENKILVLKIAQVITFQEYEEVDENNANALHIVSNAGYDQAVAVLLNAKPQFVKAKTNIGYTAMLQLRSLLLAIRSALLIVLIKLNASSILLLLIYQTYIPYANFNMHKIIFI